MSTILSQRRVAAREIARRPNGARAFQASDGSAESLAPFRAPSTRRFFSSYGMLEGRFGVAGGMEHVVTDGELGQERRGVNLNASSRMQRTKKQHYVPQTALRRFSEDGERISVFDKIRNEVRIANIRDVAQQRYFYDIPQEAIPPELEGTLDRQMIEHTLSGLEVNFNSVVGQVIDKVNSRSIVRRFMNAFVLRGKIVSRKNKRALCFFVALQYLRTREFRRTIQDGLEQFEAALRNRIPEDQVEKFFEGFRGVTDANIRMHHLSMMFDSEFVDGLSKMLYGHIMVIGKNLGQHALYSSDNPMVRQPHRTHPFLVTLALVRRVLK